MRLGNWVNNTDYAWRRRRDARLIGTKANMTVCLELWDVAKRKRVARVWYDQYLATWFSSDALGITWFPDEATARRVVEESTGVRPW